MDSQVIFDQFKRFALVGLAATATTFAILIFGVEVVGISAVAASLIGYTLGIFVNYALNYRFTFRSNNSHLNVFPKFLVVMISGLVFNAVIMLVCVDLVGLHYMLAQLIAVALVLIWSFTANRFWSFSGRR
jgi:putative flippase GtrA